MTCTEFGNCYPYPPSACKSILLVLKFAVILDSLLACVCSDVMYGSRLINEDGKQLWIVYEH